MAKLQTPSKPSFFEFTEKDKRRIDKLYKLTMKRRIKEYEKASRKEAHHG